MIPENKKRIRDAVATAGAALEGRLKPIPEIPNRNPYAHLWKEIKLFYGHSYSDCTDAQVEEILRLIEWSRANPDVFPMKCDSCDTFSSEQLIDDRWNCPHCGFSNFVSLKNNT
jgi:hypothetical protein